jgi:hypothetical protein
LVKLSISGRFPRLRASSRHGGARILLALFFIELPFKGTPGMLVASLKKCDDISVDE